MTKIVAAGPRLYAIKGSQVYSYRCIGKWQGWDVVGGPGTDIVDIAVTYHPAPSLDDADVYEVFVVDQFGQIFRQEEKYNATWESVPSP